MLSEAIVIEILRFIAVFIGGGLIQALLAGYFARRKTEAETQHEFGESAVSIANAAKLATETIGNQLVTLQIQYDAVTLKQAERDKQIKQMGEDHERQLESLRREHTFQIQGVRAQLSECLSKRDMETRETASLKTSVARMAQQVVTYQRGIARLIIQLRKNEINPEVKFSTDELRQMLGTSDDDSIDTTSDVATK